MALVDYDAMAAVYDRGRGMPLAALAAWRAVLAPYLTPRPDRPVLDLGAGTGQFARAFAEWFDADVVALEPARAMRAAARAAPAHPRIRWVAGRGENLPLRDASCAGAWLSTVIHHVPALDRCARELRRVVRPGGPVLIRSSFPGRGGGITLFRFFPGAARVAERFPSVAATVATFAAAGFTAERLEAVPQVSAPSMQVAYEQARLRADSTLAPLDDTEFARGIAALAEAAAAPGEPRPVVDYLDLLVLR